IIWTRKIPIDDHENQFLLISVGATRVLTAWKRKISSILFQWLSSFLKTLTMKGFIATGCEDGTVRYSSGIDNWCASKLLGEHVGGSAVRSLGFVFKDTKTRYIKIQAEKSPLKSDKLKIVVLPNIALIKNAKVDDYVVGFNEIGGTDDFNTEELEDSTLAVIKPNTHKPLI
ncbi:thioredoxin domain-containing protein 9, partial [Tanacetum coccineum]